MKYTLAFKNSLLLAIMLIFAFNLAAQNTAWKKKIDPILSQKAKKGKVECMVIFREQGDVSAAELFDTKLEKGTYVFNTLKQVSDRTQRSAKLLLIDAKTQFNAYYLVNSIWAVADSALIYSLAQLPEVTHIIDNPYSFFDAPIVSKNATDRGPTAVEWGIAKIKADSAWALGYKGQGAVIGGADTGYDWKHPALKKAYRGTISDSVVNHNYNFHDAIHKVSPLSADSLNPCGFNLKAPCDDGSHGTHTMGSMVGNAVDAQIGVAPAARWVACRNMERGNGANSTYIEAFEWFVAPTDSNNKNPNPSKAPHVINNSWYCSIEEGCKDSLSYFLMGTALKNTRAAGIVVVVSNGNSGPDCSTVSYPPQFFNEGFTVGATDIQDSIAGFSSRGPVRVGLPNAGKMRPDVSAPGSDIRSCIPKGLYANFSGTSMAGPHVAGTVALMISANPKLAGNVNKIEQILRETAIPLTSVQNCGGVSGLKIPNNTFGYGRINALAAVKKSLATNVATNDLQSIKIIETYPNPTADNIRFKTNEQGNATVQIFDIKGKMMLSTKVENLKTDTISMEQFLVGTYICKVMSGSQVWYAKVVKK